MIMIFPLIVLAIGALAAGLLNWPKEHLAEFLGKSPSFAMSFEMTQRAGMSVEGPLFGQIAREDHAEHALFTPAMLVGGIVSIAGILLAYALHLRNRRKSEEIAAGLQPLTGWLEAKWYVDEIYDAAIVSPLRQLGQLFFA